MSVATLLLCILSIIVIVGVAFYKIKETFVQTTTTSALMTDATNNLAIQYEQRKCAPLYNALGQMDDNMPLSQEFRLTSSSLGSNVCMMKMDDAIFSSAPSNCDISNIKLYSTDSNVIKDYPHDLVVNRIFPGNEVDPNLSTIAGTDVCYFEFKDNAGQSNIIEYASYLNSQDPNIQSLTTEVNDIMVDYNTCSNNLLSCQSLYATTNAALTQANALAAGSVLQANSLNQQIGTLSNALSSMSYSNISLQTQLDNAAQQLTAVTGLSQEVSGMTYSNQQLKNQLDNLNALYQGSYMQYGSRGYSAGGDTVSTNNVGDCIQACTRDKSCKSIYFTPNTCYRFPDRYGQGSTWRNQGDPQGYTVDVGP